MSIFPPDKIPEGCRLETYAIGDARPMTPQEQLVLVNRALEAVALNPYRRKRLIEVSQSIQAEIILEQMKKEPAA